MAKSISRYLADISSTSGVLDGTLSTAAQTNITSLGTLSSLTVSGAMNGTLSTAAQPNITSVGTLTTLAMGGSITRTGDLTLDVSGEINLDADGGKIRFKDAGTEHLRFVMDNAGVVQLYSAVQDADIKIQGNDGGSVIDALTLDMSDAGTAIFNHDAHLLDNGKLVLGTGADTQMYYDGSRLNIDNTGDIVFDTSGNIYLDADGGDVSFQDAGLETLRYGNSVSGPQFFSPVSDKDIIFKGSDGGSTITALTLDMSDAGTAIFNHDIIMNTGGTIRNTSGQELQIGAMVGDGSNTIIKSAGDTIFQYYDGSAWVENVRFDDGMVGIGTTTEADGTAMTFPLTISGANTGGNIFEAHRTANSKMQMYMSTGGLAYIDIGGTTPKLKIRTSGTDRVNIHESNGYVGLIGSSDVRLTLSSEGTEGDNSANWVRGNSAGLSFNAKTGGKHMWEINGDEKMRIHNGGQLTTEYQPSFSARLANTSSVNATSGYTVPYGGHSVPHNVGSHFSTSTYKFTAPVAGSYFFSASLRVDGFGGSYSYLTLKHEATNGTLTDRARDLTSLQATYKHHHISAVVYMTVGEKVYVDFRENGDGSVNLDADSWFNGYLLG